MKALKKIFPKAMLSVLCAIIIGCGVGAFAISRRFAKSAHADTSPAVTGYYGTNLTDPVSKTFYGILETMDFKSGATVKITDPAILEEAQAYAMGNPSILQKLGAAVDSFRYDHSEYFYVDFDMLTLNIKRKDGALIVELGAGRSNTYFVDGFTTANIPDAVTAYNNNLTQFVNGITLPAAATTAQKAESVAKAVADQIEYSFCVDADGNDTEGAQFINTSYGALKNGVGTNKGKGVCESFARLFKAAMDKLGETCVLVNGWLSDGETTELHMWNLVKDGSKWLAVDPTLVNNGDRGTYNLTGTVMVQGETLGIDHFVDKVISSSAYEMPFPQIYRNPVEEEEVGADMEQDVNGLKVEVTDGVATITYNGMDALTLTEQEGLYMAMRACLTNTGTETWYPWGTMQIYESMYYIVTNQNGKTQFSINSNKAIKYVEFAVVSADMDVEFLGNPTSYSDEFFNEHLVVKTETAIVNDEHDADYRTPPHTTVSPYTFKLEAIDGDQPQNITAEYNFKLEYIDSGDTTPEMTFTAYNSADTSKTPIADINDYASISDIKLSADNRKITFKFMPSVSYMHNEVTYVFHLGNMKTVYDDGVKADPADFIITTARDSIVCNRVFGGGKLWVQAYGTPTLVDNSDLSVKGWSYTDEQGTKHKVSQNQRSQLALVVKTPANKETIENKVDSIVGADNMMSSATYEIDINICSRIAEIPKGSFMKLSFGFPAGITADMEGVEFVVYHFEKDASGNIDYDNPKELNCVVTKYGITITVDNFSPFVIVARKSTDADKARRGIMTTVNGVGGTVKATNGTAEGFEQGMPVNFLNTAADSVTYTLTPDSGYEVEYAYIGTKEYKVTDNKLTVNYSDLEDKDNVLTVGFVNSSVKAAETAAGETNVIGEFTSNSYAAAPNSPAPSAPKKKTNKGLIALFVILGVVIAAGVAVAVVLILKKKKAENTNTNKSVTSKNNRTGNNKKK